MNSVETEKGASYIGRNHQIITIESLKEKTTKGLLGTVEFQEANTADK